MPVADKWCVVAVLFLSHIVMATITLRCGGLQWQDSRICSRKDVSQASFCPLPA